MNKIWSFWLEGDEDPIDTTECLSSYTAYYHARGLARKYKCDVYYQCQEGENQITHKYSYRGQ